MNIDTALPRVTTRFGAWVHQGLAVFSMLLLFTVKFNLVSVGQESAGLRIDDALILCMGVMLAAGWLVQWRTHLASIEKRFLVFAFVLLLSNCWNLREYQQGSLLYTIRNCEYFLFFYFGIYYAGVFRLTPLVTTLLTVNGALMLVQATGRVGGFSSTGYDAGHVRPMGLTGGSWEVGALINFYFAILVARAGMTTKKTALLFAVTFILLLLTGARMPAVAHVVILLLYFKRTSKNAALALSKFLLPAAIVFLLFLLVPNPVSKRSSNLLSMNNIKFLTYEYRSLPTPQRYVEFPPLPAEDETTELSWIARAVKWSYVTKLWVSQPVAWFFGIGPGTAGLALDGGWLRVLVEDGVVGLACFLALFHAISKLDIVMRDMTVALFISMIMIDLHLAYKAMSFFFFVAGCFYQRKRAADDARRSLLADTMPSSL